MLVFLCNSCNDPLKFRKKDTIPRKDFVSILAEMHILDAMTSHHSFYGIYIPQDTLDIYGHIYKKYGYTRTDFDSTVAQYIMKPELFDRVYNEVLMKLNYMLDTLEKNSPVFEEEIEEDLQ